MTVLAVRAATGSLARDLIDENFGIEHGSLSIGGFRVSELTDAYGSPLYVYDGDVIERRFVWLSRAVAGFADVFYSIKANPNPAIARVLVERGAGVEIASGGELVLALAAGAHPGRILFAGPGKSAEELEFAIAQGVGEIHLETFEEIADVAAIARRMSRKVDVAIRVNPGSEAQGGAIRMGGKPVAFGFDEEILGDVVRVIKAHENLTLSGLHLFAGTQILDSNVLLKQWQHGLSLAARLGQLVGRPLKSIDLGGGLGIPYYKGDVPLDLDRIGAGVSRLEHAKRADPFTSGAKVMIEPGRYLVGPAGVYLTRVRAVKFSRDHRFVITDGGMHHHLAASGNLGQVIKRDYPIAAATRLDAPETAPAIISGPLCTPLDTLARHAELPELNAGEILAVLQSGAYGLSSSPVGFLSHPMPAEVLVRGGSHHCIRVRGNFWNPLVNIES